MGLLFTGNSGAGDKNTNTVLLHLLLVTIVMHRHTGVAVTQGTRYILAGFCDYGMVTTSEHKKIVNWDLFFSNYNPLFDGYAAGVGMRTGDLIRAVSTCSQASDGTIVQTLLRLGFETTFKDWQSAATSCEKLAPNLATTLVVLRSVDKN